jgi:hypothetical protein
MKTSTGFGPGELLDLVETLWIYGQELDFETDIWSFQACNSHGRPYWQALNG